MQTTPDRPLLYFSIRHQDQALYFYADGDVISYHADNVLRGLHALAAGLGFSEAFHQLQDLVVRQLEGYQFEFETL